MNGRQSQGFSVVELLVAMFVLVVGILGLSAGFLSTTRLVEESGDSTLLNSATQNVIQTLRGVPFSAVTTAFGPGSGQEQIWCTSDGTIAFTDPGDAFATGQIELFNDESAIPASFAGLAGGFDLNGNGVVDSGQVADYILLPVRVTLTIPLPNGSRALSADFFFTSW